MCKPWTFDRDIFREDSIPEMKVGCLMNFGARTSQGRKSVVKSDHTGGHY